MIDVHVYVSRWPFRRLPDDDTASLVTRLRRGGVTRAWTGSFDALLHRDLTAVNTRLANECRERGEDVLVPFGAINPVLPGWKDDLQRCTGEYGMPGIRLHPNYHGYTLEDSAFNELLDAAEERNLIVQIVARMEDERTQHPLVRVPVTDLTPLGDRLKDRQSLRVVVSCGLRNASDTVMTTDRKSQVYYDIAVLEGINGVGRILKNVPHERLLFASMSPLFYLESARLKLRESEIGHTAEAAITRENARSIMSGGTQRE